MTDPTKDQPSSPIKAAGSQAIGRVRDALSSARGNPAPPTPDAPKPAQPMSLDSARTARMPGAGGQPMGKPLPGSKPAPAAKPLQGGKPLPGQRPGAAPQGRGPMQQRQGAMATAQQQAPRPRPKGTRVRKARLRLSRIDPWSMMKTASLFAIAGGIMFWVATYVTWAVVEASGLFDQVNKTVGSIVNPDEGAAEQWRIEQFISANKVLGFAALVAVINVLLSTALATLAAFLYNLAASMLGGLEVTLAED